MEVCGFPWKDYTEVFKCLVWEGEGGGVGDKFGVSYCGFKISSIFLSIFCRFGR